MLILDESLHLKYSDVHNVFCAKSLYNSPNYLFKSFSSTILKGSYDAISSFPFSLECYKLIVHR